MMNNKTLVYIFLALLGLYGINHFISERKTRTFKAELISVDTAQVSAIVINAQNSIEEVSLKKEGLYWIVSSGRLNLRALSTEVNLLLSSLMSIPTSRIAAKTAEKWSEFEVGEQEGTRIRIYEEGALKWDFILGKISFNPQNKTSTSYLRHNGEKEVYAIDGSKTQILSRGFKTYRNKTISKIPAKATITHFIYENIDTSFSIQHTPAGWQLNEDIRLDSQKIEDYLNLLRNLSGTTFADDFDETQASEKQINRLVLESDQLPDPIVITAFQDTMRSYPYILHSSLNSEAWFSSDSSGLYWTLFKDTITTSFLRDLLE